jgi:GNAT superfamily N-acetyltransferase
MSDGADGAFDVVRLTEAEVGTALGCQLRSLLRSSFAAYPDRSYYKLPPHFRFLALLGGDVVAQTGVELRIIRVGEHVLRTFGVVDLCVRTDMRSRGLGTRLLREVIEYAGASGMDFVLLFADDDRLYVENGWRRVGNACSWLRIDEHVTLGVARDEMPGTLMVRTVQGDAWPEGAVDLLGHLF